MTQARRVFNSDMRPSGYGFGDIVELAETKHGMRLGFSAMNRCTRCGRDVPTVWLNGNMGLYGEDMRKPIVGGLHGWIERPDRIVKLDVYLCWDCMQTGMERLLLPGPPPAPPVEKQKTPPPRRTRKPLSQRERFEILVRDQFTCCYCGAKAPNVRLEVDHIHPVSQGGTNDPSNLRTACEDCNRGKGALVISSGERQP